MNSFLDSKGTLRVTVAEGIISGYEVNNLTEGSYTYFQDRDAGHPVSVYFNNNLFAYGEVIILDGSYGVRLIKNREWKRESFTEKPQLGDKEIFKSELILGEREITVRELNSLVPGSLIAIQSEAPFTQGKPTLGKVRVNGLDVAIGSICLNEEKWILKVETPLFNKEEGIPRRDSYIPPDERIKYYDFSRPDCITRNHFKKIKRLHDFFGRYTGWHVMAVDQLTWKELKDEHPSIKMVIAQKEHINSKRLGDDATFFLPLANNIPEGQSLAF